MADQQTQDSTPAAPKAPAGTPDKEKTPASLWIAPLVAAGAALATGVTGLAVTGTLGRVQRNHPDQFAWAIGFAVMAAACWIMAATVARKSRKDGLPGWARPVLFWEWTSKPWLIIGIGLAVAGVVVGYQASIDTAGEPERPRVTMAVDPTTLLLTGSAKVGHLSSDKPLTIAVDGMVYEQGALKIARRLAETSVGPDSDGDATQDISVRIPPGQFDVVGVRATIKTNDEPVDACGTYPTATASPVPAKRLGSAHRAGTKASKAERDRLQAERTKEAERVELAGLAAPDLSSSKPKAGTGCQYLTLPPRNQRPRLGTRWIGTGRRLLGVTVTTSNAATAGAARSLLHLEVTGWDGKHLVTLGRQVREVSEPGAPTETARLLVPRNIRRVCAQAWLSKSSRITRRARCPVRGRVAGAMVQIVGPVSAKPIKKKA